MNAQQEQDLKKLQRHLDKVWETEQAERRAQQVAKRKTEEIDVDDILDEIEDEEFDDLDEDDDPTVAPKARKGRARKTSSKKKSSAKKSEEGGVGTNEVAEAAGTDSRSLRMLLRKEFPREEGGRYHWSSLNHPEVKAIIKRVRSGGAKDAKAAQLDELKSKRSKKKASEDDVPAKKTGSKKKATASKSDAAKKRAAARRKARREAAAEDDDE